MLQGFPSNHMLAIPTWARSRSASVSPVPNSMAREPTWARVWVNRAL